MTYSGGSTAVPTGLICSQLAPCSLWHWPVYSPGAATHGVLAVGGRSNSPSEEVVVGAYGNSGPLAPLCLASAGFTHTTSLPTLTTPGCSSGLF